MATRLFVEYSEKPCVEVDLAPGVKVTPAISPEYWLMRVPVSDKQAVVCFKKFGLFGIGFQHEVDWNTNLPSSVPANTIYEHIEVNRMGANKATCIKAIKLLQEEVRKLNSKSA